MKFVLSHGVMWPSCGPIVLWLLGLQSPMAAKKDAEGVCLHAADPYVNDATFTISMLTLEELGATGNKVPPPPLPPAGWTSYLNSSGAWLLRWQES